MTNYQTRAAAELFNAFGHSEFTAWDAADVLQSPYGNACSTLKGLVKSGDVADLDGVFLVPQTRIKLSGSNTMSLKSMGLKA